MKEGRWGILRVFMLVLGVIFVGMLIFAGSQFVLRGHVDQALTIDIEKRLHPETPDGQRGMVRQAEPYHYDFFTLLDQPVPERALPELDLPQNPALKTRVKVSELKLSGNFAIQVSSFSSSSDALALARELQSQGYLAVIVNDVVDGKGRYRVRIDGGKQRENAEQIQAALARKTGFKGMIVTL